MLNKLRTFSKTKLAGVLVAIIIVPFVFWGMGAVFSGGNKNNLAKVNNINISTKDFIDYINTLRLDPNIIKENIDKNILEEILAEIISKTLLDNEIQKLGLNISDKELASLIKKNQIFLDENNKFSRIKYEKFLLENNFTASNFEERLKNEELKKKFFSYIGNGIKIPFFLSNKEYNEQTQEIDIEYINLENVYKKEFNEYEIDQYISKNKDVLKNDYINFSYIKINPNNLIQSNEFSNEFFNKIDEIENLILNGSNIKEIENKYNLNIIKKNKYIIDNEDNEILKEIYNKRYNEEKIQILDKNDFFLLYEINKIESILPNKNNIKFIKKVNSNLYESEKYKFNRDLLTKIQKNEFKNSDFVNLVKSKNLIVKKKIKSINDKDLFESNSLKILYSLPKNSFVLMIDQNKNTYLSKILNIDQKKLEKQSGETNVFDSLAKSKFKSNLFVTYDLFLKNEYKIKINKQTVKKLKNYFR